MTLSRRGFVSGLLGATTLATVKVPPAPIIEPAITGATVTAAELYAMMVSGRVYFDFEEREFIKEIDALLNEYGTPIARIPVGARSGKPTATLAYGLHRILAEEAPDAQA